MWIPQVHIFLGSLSTAYPTTELKDFPNILPEKLSQLLLVLLAVDLGNNRSLCPSKKIIFFSLKSLGTLLSKPPFPYSKQVSFLPGFPCRPAFLHLLMPFSSHWDSLQFVYLLLKEVRRSRHTQKNNQYPALQHCTPLQWNHSCNPRSSKLGRYSLLATAFKEQCCML